MAKAKELERTIDVIQAEIADLDAAVSRETAHAAELEKVSWKDGSAAQELSVVRSKLDGARHHRADLLAEIEAVHRAHLIQRLGNGIELVRKLQAQQPELDRIANETAAQAAQAAYSAKENGLAISGTYNEISNARNAALDRGMTMDEIQANFPDFIVSGF